MRVFVINELHSLQQACILQSSPMLYILFMLCVQHCQIYCIRTWCIIVFSPLSSRASILKRPGILHVFSYIFLPLLWNPYAFSPNYIKFLVTNSWFFRYFGLFCFQCFICLSSLSCFPCTQPHPAPKIFKRWLLKVLDGIDLELLFLLMQAMAPQPQCGSGQDRGAEDCCLLQAEWHSRRWHGWRRCVFMWLKWSFHSLC